MEHEIIRASPKPSIQLILNENGRVDQFRGLFEQFARHGVGKLTETHFCLTTAAVVNPRNGIESMFVLIQDDAARRGYQLNCFCLKPQDDQK